MKGMMKEHMKCIRLLLAAAAMAVCLVAVPAVKVQADVAPQHLVVFVYGTNIHAQYVPHGGNAVVPTDTSLAGYIFNGWTANTTNIQTDMIILGAYTQIEQNVQWYESTTGTRINNNTSAPFPDWWKDLNLPKGEPGVTCAVHWYNGWTGEYWKTDMIPYGASLPTPQDPCIDGLEFTGWEGDWTNVTEDRAIKAWYFRYYTVKLKNGVTGETMDIQKIRRGGSARKPDRDPKQDGYEFTGWDRGFDDIQDNTTITANFKKK